LPAGGAAGIGGKGKSSLKQGNPNPRFFGNRLPSSLPGSQSSRNGDETMPI
jgi:hypothetical protein